MAKTKRFINARTIEFPAGSDWREQWTEVRILAVGRGVSNGSIVLEAIRQYVQAQKKKGKA